MDNQDIMLKVLEKLESLDQGQKELLDRVTNIETRVTKIEEHTEVIENRVTKIEVVQENVTNRNIQLLLDGHVGLNDRLKQVEPLIEKVSDIQDTVEVLKAFTVRK